MGPREAEIPERGGLGTYVLVLEASAGRRVRVGALGALEVRPGFYTYVGSARGPGGLAARLAHHRRRARSPHWHVDYLRRHTALREIWFARSEADWEHGWAGALGSTPRARVPLAGFGASDCRCLAHLFAFTRRPRVSAFRRRLRAVPPPVGAETHPDVLRWVAHAPCG